MDLSQLQAISSLPNSRNDDLSTELAHINQEMYKKNFELAEKNKTLSLLREIDDIIRSIVTDTKQIAQQVTSILVLEAGFKIAGICLLEPDKSMLSRIALSEASSVITVKNYRVELQSHIVEVPLSNQSIFAAAIKDGVAKTTSDISELFLYDSSKEDLGQFQIDAGIKSFSISPLIVRGRSLGTMTVGLADEEQNISFFQKDLLYRLSDVIGIALDNAMLYNQLQSANEKLKALDKLKDEFVSLASHELRTPMTAIKSYLWMAINGKGGPLNEKQKYYLDRSYSSTERLIHLVNDMLNVSRIESGRISLVNKEVDLNALIKEVIIELTPRVQELGLNLIFTPIQLPTVVADADKVREVLINLVGNSFKFTPKDGKITIACVQKNDTVEVSIADTGVGISQEDLPKLFKKFSMVGNSYLTKQNTQGTGLGLYISKSIIEMHGGNMWVTSGGTNKGTTFTFSLKVCTQAEKEKLPKPIDGQQVAPTQPTPIIPTSVS